MNILFKSHLILFVLEVIDFIAATLRIFDDELGLGIFAFSETYFQQFMIPLFVVQQHIIDDVPHEFFGILLCAKDVHLQV